MTPYFEQDGITLYHGDFLRGCTCEAGTECRCKTRDTETAMRHLQEHMQ